MKPTKLSATFAVLLFLAIHAFGAADLVPSKLLFLSTITNPPLPKVTFTWGITNQGDMPAAGFFNAIYISTNATIDNFTPQVASWYFANPIPAGGAYSKTETFQLPIGYSGAYYIIFKVNPYNNVQESDYDNNLLVLPLTLTVVPSDLAVQSVLLPSALTVPPNPYLTLIWSVTNLGPGIASGNVFDNVYLSTSPTLSPDAMSLGPFYSSVSIPPGQVSWQTNQVHPNFSASGNYYLIFVKDLYNALFELNTNNNYLSVPISFSVKQPDLAVLPLPAPASVTSLANPVLSLVLGVTNVGPVVAEGYWNDSVYLSTNSVLDEQKDIVLWRNFENGPFAPGTNYFRTNSVQLPVVQSGTYYLIFETDTHNTLSESNLANNLRVQAITFDIQQPDLTPLSFQVPTVLTTTPNPFLKLSWGVTNQGIGATGPNAWFDRVYFSTNAVFDSSATPVSGSYEANLDAGDSYFRTNLVQVPVTQNGTYYLIFRTDEGNVINESNTNNNTVIKPITLTILPPNLAPIALQVAGPITSPPNPTVQVIWGVTNNGVGSALGNWSDWIYFSTDPQLDPSDTLQLVGQQSAPVPAGGSYWHTNSTQLPITQSGTYYLILSANNEPYNKLFESDYSDNLRTVPITVNILPPDLAPVISHLPSKITGPPFPTATVVWGITNQGTGTAKGTFWNDVLFLSTDSTLELTDPPVGAGYESGPIPPGGVLWLTNDATLPVTTNGTYYFIARANLNNNLFESDYNNNTAVSAVTVDIHPPDLVPVALQVPSVVSGPAYPTINLVWGVTNQGTGDAIVRGAWWDHFYISTNAIWDNTAVDFFTWGETGPVAPGDTYWQTNSAHLPITTAGSYYLFLKVNLYQDLVESDYSNNVIGVPITFNLQPPDLAPVPIQVPSSVTGPPYPTLTFVWGVTNQGAGTAQAYYASWSDVVGLSTNDYSDPSDYRLTSSYQTTAVPPGGIYYYTNSMRAPVTQSGTYYLHFITDEAQILLDANYDNNTLTTPVTFTIQPPDLAPVALLAPAALTCPPNPTLTMVWGVTNQGTGPAVGFDRWYDQLYFSTDPVWNPQDTVLATGSEGGPIPAGQTYWRTNSVRLPVTQSGTYYLILRADDNDFLLESNEANNMVVVPITLTVQPPDLVPLPPALPLVVTGPPNPAFTLLWGVTNQGIGQAVAPWNDGVYFSKNARLDPQDPSIFSIFHNVPINPGTMERQTNQVWAPVTQSGDYYLIFNVNLGGGNSLYESDYSNNLVIVPVTFNIQRPDLAPVALQVPAQITTTPNPFIQFQWGITNLGLGAATSPYSSPYWSDALYLSTNAVLDDTAQLIFVDFNREPVASGEAYWRTNLISVPVTQSGTYYFILQADSNGFLFESDYNNNTIAAPVTLTIQPPDLAPVALLSSLVVTSTPNPQLSVVWGVTNQGIGAAQGNWYDSLYISTNNTFDGTAIQVYSRNENSPVPVGTNYWRTNLVQLPVVQSGDYFLLFTANANRTLFESNFANNFFATHLTLTILPPDLHPIALRAPSIVTAPPNPSINLEWGVTNQGLGAAVNTVGFWGGWSDRIYLSANPNQTGIYYQLIGTFERGPISPKGQYWRSQWAQVPVTASGTYYLTLQTDADQGIFESDEGNNTLSVPIVFNIQQPDLKPLAVQFPNVVNDSANPNVKITWGVTNQGTGAALGSWQDSFYLSKDSTLDSSDILMGSQYQRGLPTGSSYWRSQKMLVPVKESGNYYIILQTGAGTAIGESDTGNNTLAVPITFNLPAPDLMPVGFQVPSQLTTSPYPKVEMIWGVTNQGPGRATNTTLNFSWYDRVYLSTNAALDVQNDLLVFSDYAPTQLGSHETYWRTNLVRLPVTQDGSYYLHLQANADPYQPLYESDYANNVATAPIHLQVEAPDLAALTLQGPTNVTGAEGQLITFVWAVTNQGPGAALGTSAPWTDLFRLNKLNPSDGSQGFIAAWGFPQTRVVNPAESYWSTNSIAFPAIEPGIYQLTLTADPYDDLAELTLSNNGVSIQIAVNLVPPDVTPIAFSAPSVVSGPSYPQVTVTWGVTNQSISAALPNYSGWFDRLYLSTNAFLDQAAVYVTDVLQTDFVGAGGSYWRTNTVQLPVQRSGKYYLLLYLDVYHALGETNETNNFASFPITVNLSPAPDLKPVVLQAPTTIDGPPNLSLTFVWGVTNQGAGMALGIPGWYDTLSSSILPPPNDTDWLLAVFQETNQLAPGGVYWRTNTIGTQVAASGQYYFFFKTDAQGNLFESDYGNNLVSVPVTFNILPPDLAPLALLAPTAITGAPNPTVSFVVGVTNQGVGTALPGNDALYISTTPFVDSSAQIAAYLYRSNAIPPGGSYWLTNSLRLPALDSGNYYLLFQADVGNALGEFEWLNNLAVAPLRLNLSLQPDLALHEFQCPSTVTGAANPRIQVIWHVVNEGLGPAVGTRGDTLTVYTNLNTFIGTPVARVSSSDILPVGVSYWRTNRFTLPLAQSGTCYLSLTVNDDFNVPELDYGNNRQFVSLNVIVTNAQPVGLAGGRMLPDGTFQVGVSATPGGTYTLETSTNLLDWTRVMDFVCTNTTMWLRDPEAPRFAQRFYRVAPYLGEYATPLFLDFGGLPSPSLGGLELKLDGPLTGSYRVQMSTNLVQWTAITNFPNIQISPVLFRDDSAGGDTRRFYRAISP